jgi:4'-phosphopantetheinyl transferase
MKHADRWTIPPTMPRLESREAHVWRASVAQWETSQPALVELLDPAERQRAAQFAFPADRQRFVAAHAVLRILLARYLGTTAARLSFTTAAAGKPHVVGPAGAANIEFNMSHAGDCIMIAVTPVSPVGVDVEYWVGDVDEAEFSSEFFSEYEREELRQISRERQHAAFFALWTRKEALVKATGKGLSQGLAHFDMTVDPDTAPRLLADRLHRENEARWRVCDLALDARYSGALVVDRRVTAVRAFRAEPTSLLVDR